MITTTIQHLGKTVCFLCAAMILGTAAVSMSAAPLSGASASVSGQDEVSVSGTVTDEQGEPLIGASVLIKGTTVGSITDLDGKFSIKIPVSGADLEISYIGYITKEVTVTTQDNLTIALEPDNKLLDEVVVIGYGTVKRKDLTGSVASVRGDDIAARKTTTLSTALQGSLSGVLVQRSSSAPGASASSIRVRGVTTMGTSDPLIIVDGVQTDDIDYVNSNDVESITVLKDAAAASIYGAKAAAGVILITTRRGSATDLTISYNGEFGWEIPTEQPQMVGLTRYLEMSNELLYNDNNGGGFYQQYQPDQIRNWVSNNATDPDNYPITDWNSLILKKSAPRTTHTVTVNGGNDVVRSSVSLAYDQVNALYDGRKFQRYMLRANNDFTIIKDRLYATLDINIRRAKNDRPVYEPFDELRKIPAIYPAVWENGAYADGKSGANPYALIHESGTNTAWSTQIGGKASLELRPVKGLSIQAIISPFINYTKTKQFKQAAYWYSKDDPTVIGGTLEGGGQSYTSTSLSEQRNDNYHVTSQVIANYMETFREKHNLNVMVGYENYVMKSENLGAGRDFYDLTSYPYLNVGPEEYQTNNGTASEYTSNSFFGRIMYDYDGRYLVQANVREDASSRFARNYRWGTFPSFSAGWVISEENWMQSTRNWLSFLKLRASWGMLGNERIGSNYFPYMALVSFNDALFYDSPDGGVVVSDKASIMNNLAVEDITWETTTSTDIGLDLGFFNQRLHATFDWYWKNTDPLLAIITTKGSMGVTSIAMNAGAQKTHGWEATLKISPIYRPHEGINWNISLNATSSRSRYADIGDSFSELNEEGKASLSGTTRYYDGGSPTAIWAVRSAGIDPATGRELFIKKDGSYSFTYDADDEVVVGDTEPKIEGILGTTLYYKGLSFGAYFRYQLGGQVFNTSLFEKVENIGTEDVYNNQDKRALYDRWSTSNREAYFKGISLVQTTSKSSRFVMDENTFTGESFYIGYEFPDRIVRKMRLGAMSVQLSMSDMFRLSSVRVERGTDYPFARSVSLSVGITF